MAQRLLVSTSERMVAGSNPGCVGASDSALRGRRSVLKDVSVYARLDFAFAIICNEWRSGGTRGSTVKTRLSDRSLTHNDA